MSKPVYEPAAGNQNWVIKKEDGRNLCATNLRHSYVACNGVLVEVYYRWGATSRREEMQGVGEGPRELLRKKSV